MTKPKMKAYIYPVTAREQQGLYNPYINNFVNSLNSDIDFLNCKNPSQVGILDLWKYIWKIDVLFLNWIEDLPSKKGGEIQWLIFRFIFIPVLRSRNAKICWTLHNKQSHGTNNFINFNKLFSVSNYIITHAGEGKTITESKGYSKKLIFFHHPINKRDRTKSDNKTIDIFIWGTITPYKGIDLFLDQVTNNTILKKYSIVIAGKITDEKYKTLIEKKISGNIKLINKFLTDSELEKNLRSSKITLFTYNQDSVLSSGALADSIGFGNIIVGPDVGSFKDIKEMNLIYTFQNRNQIPSLCEKLLSDFRNYQIDDALVSKYLRDHSWEKFGQKIMQKIR